MPSFRYTAVGPSGKLAHGVMEGPTEAAIVHRLQRDGHTPISAEPVAAGAKLPGLLQFEFARGGLRRQELANLTRELATMLAAGQDLDRALLFLVETTRTARIAAPLERLRAAVRDGHSLSSAMARDPRSFPRLYIGLVRAGEAGGTLAPTLERLALLLERERSLAASIRAAMVYPVLLLLAMIGSVTFLLTKVLPQFVPLFAENGAALPPATQFLMHVGDWISAYGLWLLLAIAVFALLLRQALKGDALRLRADRLLLRLPVIGGLIRDILAARFSRTLGTLLVNGVPLITALGIVRDVVGNRAAVAAIEQATASAKSGAGLVWSLEAADVFPRRTVHLLRLGEETAQLGQVALRAAEIHEEATRLGIQGLVALLVPGITILMGAIVAWIVSSLMLAMISLNNLAN